MKLSRTILRSALVATTVSISTVMAGASAPAMDYGSQYPTQLQDVLALSPTNAWAVGYLSNGNQALIYHWNGSVWSAATNPMTGSLYSLAASSANDVWAVGGYTAPHTHSLSTLTLHWNGSQWSTIPSPSPSSLFNPLLGVTALSPSNAWAVGYTVNASDTTKHHALALHWNGTKWSHVSVPGRELYDVDATSARHVWAVGEKFILRWNGSRWAKQYRKAGTQIFGISALSSHNVWAVGDLAKLHDAKATLALHWNGHKWSRMRSPNPTFYNQLSSVHAISAKNVWAVGCHGPDDACLTSDTLILHWNGSKWSKVASPHPGPKGDRLGGVSGDASNDVWAVGGAASSSDTAALVLHWNGSGWSQSPLP